jgi:hypothetical protein
MKICPIAALLTGLVALGADMREVSAQKEAITGAGMVSACRAFLEGPEALKNATKEENLRAGFCAGYVVAMLTEETEACVPPMTGKDAVAKVVEYLEAHPDELNDGFEDIVDRAFIANWPCKP